MKESTTSYRHQKRFWTSQCSGARLRTELTKRRMDEWCTNQHGKSGLTQACIDSPNTIEDVTQKVMDYVKKWVPNPKAGLLAGSSVHADKT